MALDELRRQARRSRYDGLWEVAGSPPMPDAALSTKEDQHGSAPF